MSKNVAIAKLINANVYTLTILLIFMKKSPNNQPFPLRLSFSIKLLIFKLRFIKFTINYKGLNLMFTEYISTETLFTKELEIELKSGIADKSYYIRQKE